MCVLVGVVYYWLTIISIFQTYDLLLNKKVVEVPDANGSFKFKRF